MTQVVLAASLCVILTVLHAALLILIDCWVYRRR